MTKKKKPGGGLYVDGKLVHRTKPRETKPDPQRIQERLARQAIHEAAQDGTPEEMSDA